MPNDAIVLWFIILQFNCSLQVRNLQLRYFRHTRSLTEFKTFWSPTVTNNFFTDKRKIWHDSDVVLRAKFTPIGSSCCQSSSSKSCIIVSIIICSSMAAWPRREPSRRCTTT